MLVVSRAGALSFTYQTDPLAVSLAQNGEGLYPLELRYLWPCVKARGALISEFTRLKTSWQGDGGRSPEIAAELLRVGLRGSAVGEHTPRSRIKRGCVLG